MVSSHKRTVHLLFKEIEMPESFDILVVGRELPADKMEILNSTSFLSAYNFDVVELQHPQAQAYFINRKLLKRISHKEAKQLLDDKVLPYVSEGEITKVDLSIVIRSKASA